MSWSEHVEAAKRRGFDEVTVLDRASGSSLASTREGAVEINENQELLKALEVGGAREITARGERYEVLLRDDQDGEWIITARGERLRVAVRFRGVDFVAEGAFKGVADAIRDARGKSVPDAFISLRKQIAAALGG